MQQNKSTLTHTTALWPERATARPNRPPGAAYSPTRFAGRIALPWKFRLFFDFFGRAMLCGAGFRRRARGAGVQERAVFTAQEHAGLLNKKRPGRNPAFLCRGAGQKS